MSQFLPPYLLALFAPRDPVPYLPPLDKLPHEKKRQPYTGLAEYLDQFEEPEETPPPVKIETRIERIERKRQEKAEQNAYKLEQNLAMWDPYTNTTATGNAYKTLFVARINYDTSESKLKREFEVYGKIKQIKLVNDQMTSKPRGYAFIEFEEESAMHAAYKKADGKKIDGRRVVVDVERGRTIKGWKPRRLGGGKGGRKSHLDPLSASGTMDATANSQLTSSGGGRDRDRESRSDRERDRGADERGGNTSRRERERERSKSRSRSKSREKERRKRSKSRDRQRSRSRSRSRDRSAKKSKRSSTMDTKMPIKV